nr:MAG TPA: hypothetical protein [Caudoviricetes sp.]
MSDTPLSSKRPPAHPRLSSRHVVDNCQQKSPDTEVSRLRVKNKT